MALADLLTFGISHAPADRPRDDELDLFGLTHPGKVRKENQDHFLVATIHPQAVVQGTSLPDVEHLPLRGGRLATMLLVADGVGSGAGGEASQLAAEVITGYVTTTLRCYHTAGSSSDKQFYEALTEAALEAHTAVLTQAQGDKMATTLTLGVAVWPWLYTVQVGDSRCYVWNEKKGLQQVTRDQTVAQELVDRGALPRDSLPKSPLSHVLASAIGGHEAKPVVSRTEIPRGCVVVLCSDGLTKHVSNKEIEQQVSQSETSEQLCRTLLDLALERGGSDNITVLVARARRPS
ncbi:MAG TPA: protein phosphatase 2C domain-containing protein [Gemmatimonadales bacterium]|jgi:protein phosphatase|nr:protein phosphatase 2C domain-containing protein [Gemmatimonadales bacterium]